MMIFRAMIFVAIVFVVAAVQWFGGKFQSGCVGAKWRHGLVFLFCFGVLLSDWRWRSLFVR
jgi:cytochrome c oxidase assembly factor CtaG